MAAQDLIVSFLSSVPKDVTSRFATPPVLHAVPGAPLGQGRSFYQAYLSKYRDAKGAVLPNLFKASGGTELGRVCVMGFSNGVDSGIGQLLELASDASKIDVCCAFDGIHGSFVKGPSGTAIKDPITKKPVLVTASYGKWIAFAARAAAKKPSADPKAQLCLITHSSVEPDFPSTTETANYIWEQVLPNAPADYEAAYWSELDDLVYPGGLTIASVDTAGTGQPMPKWTWKSFSDGWYDRRVCNGLSVFGWGDPGKSALGRIQAACRDRYNQTADHIFQAKAVLPAILHAYLVPRWNPSCGPMPAPSTSGLGDEPVVCSPGEGLRYDEAPDEPLVSPIPIPAEPTSCPYPKGGDVLVGSKQSPCATTSPPVPMPPPPGAALSAMGAALVGAAVGFGAVRCLQRRR